ncbi:MAG: helix-turn-helix domain-containing protein, partial [Planctomycetaceae bacterium]
ENAIERAVVLTRGDLIIPGDLPPEVQKAAGPAELKSVLLDEKTLSIPLGTPLEAIEKRVIEETLRHSRGDKNLASKILGISARTIYRKMEEEKEGGKEENQEDQTEKNG